MVDAHCETLLHRRRRRTTWWVILLAIGGIMLQAVH